MHGSGDQITSFESSKKFADESMQTSFHEWPGLYHEIFNEPEKQQVLDFTLDWIYKKNPQLAENI